MTTTIAQACKAIADTLSAATGLTYIQNYDTLKDGMQDWPTLQVYWDDLIQDPTGNADRSTFQAGVRDTVVTILADLYAQQRAHLGEDMAALIPLVDAIRAEFEKQDTKDYFSQHGMQAFQWQARRVTFTYGDPAVSYIGARFTITVRLF